MCGAEGAGPGSFTEVGLRPAAAFTLTQPVRDQRPRNHRYQRASEYLVWPPQPAGGELREAR